MATDLKWWSGLGGVAGVLASGVGKESFDNGLGSNWENDLQKQIDEMDRAAAAASSSINKTATVIATGLIIFFVVYIIISILLIVLAYKMFPDNKGLHAIMTFLLGLFWLIPAMLYYLFGLKGYHMKGIRIVKRA